MLEIHYRTAELVDVPALARLPRPGEAGGDPPERMARYLAGEHHPQQALPPRVLWMASHAGAPIGVGRHRRVLTAAADCNDVYRLRTPASDAEWAAYHAIRRTVLFERRGRRDEYNPSHPDELRGGNYPLLLLYRGEPVGTIRVDLTPGEAILRRVAVREDVQRRGHGRQMLMLAERFIRAQGRTRIRSHVDPGAVGFYERCGFVGDGADPHGATVVMIKTFERLSDQ